MNRARFLVVVLACILSLTPACNAQGGKPEKAVDPKLVKNFTATKSLRLDEAVADFVIDLIRKNTAGVQDQYRKLTAKTEADAGGRYAARRFEGIQWFVNEESWRNTDTEFERNGDYTYLARQQLVFGMHRGQSVPVNVVGQVRVITSHNGKGEGPSDKEGTVAAGTKVTLTFEGFLNSVPVQAPE